MSNKEKMNITSMALGLVALILGLTCNNHGIGVGLVGFSVAATFSSLLFLWIDE